MAWSSVGTLGSANEKVSDTAISMTTSATAEVGNVIVVCVACDNDTSGDAATTDITVTDSAGNTYTRAVEFRNGQAAAAGGAQAGIYYTKVTTQLSSGGTITATHASSVTAKAITSWEFSFAAGSTISVAGSTTLASDGNAEPGALTVGSLASKEYLWVVCNSVEDAQGTHTYTEDADYTAMTRDGTTGGVDPSNMSVYGAFRIFIGTTDTHDASVTDGALNSDVAGVMAVLEEITADVATYPGCVGGLGGEC